MLQAYRKHVEERVSQGLPPLPLDAKQVAELVELLKQDKDSKELLDLLVHRVPPGVDQAAYVKAAFLTDVAKGKTACKVISREYARELLGTMLGGYNIQSLIDFPDDAKTAPTAAKALSTTLLIYDAFHDVADKAKNNPHAKQVVQAWADAEWFTRRDALADEIIIAITKGN